MLFLEACSQSKDHQKRVPPHGSEQRPLGQRRLWVCKGVVPFLASFSLEVFVLNLAGLCYDGRPRSLWKIIRIQKSKYLLQIIISKRPKCWESRTKDKLYSYIATGFIPQSGDKRALQLIRFYSDGSAAAPAADCSRSDKTKPS